MKLSCFFKIELQSVIFSRNLSRFNLQNVPYNKSKDVFTIHIHRNQSFEFIASVLPMFLAYSNLEVDIFYSDYDSSLNFSNITEADIHLIWLDYSQYLNRINKKDKLIEWLEDRIIYLRTLTKSPILINNCLFLFQENSSFNILLQNLTERIMDVYICDQTLIFESLGSKFFDLRMSRFTGTPLSDIACLHNARMFGLRWLPALLKPRLKAVVFDLDNTLYSGVLGEDGVDGIVLNDSYISLHKYILQLREEGVFLALCSHNELLDVEKLFDKRFDFPLKLKDFSAIEISWENKAIGIEKIAQKLRVGIDSILFVDDNYGELANVSQHFPQIHCLLASINASETEQALRLFPNLWHWKRDVTDKLRVRDLEANQERENLMQKSHNSFEYLKSLDVQLDIFYKPNSQRFRLHELSIKTNQFNTGLLRFSEQGIEQYLKSSNYHVISFSLQDKLSDSGVIGALFAHEHDNILIVDEICVSCRALGRGFEDFMIANAVNCILQLTSISFIDFCFVQGERNKPAQTWLCNFTKKTVTEKKVTISVTEFIKISSQINNLPIIVQWR